MEASAEVVIVNCGGVRFETTRATLLSGTEEGKASYFHALLHFQKANSNSSPDLCFIDRDAALFAFVLNWLRDRSARSLARCKHLEALRAEADYFLLPNMVKQIEDLLHARQLDHQKKKKEMLERVFVGSLAGTVIVGAIGIALYCIAMTYQQPTDTSATLQSTSNDDESFDFHSKVAASAFTFGS